VIRLPAGVREPWVADRRSTGPGVYSAPIERPPRGDVGDPHVFLSAGVLVSVGGSRPAPWRT